jgi:hypothetical protein
MAKRRWTFALRSKGSVLVDAFSQNEAGIGFQGEVGAYASTEIRRAVRFVQRGLKIRHSGTDETGRN